MLYIIGCPSLFIVCVRFSGRPRRPAINAFLQNKKATARGTAVGGFAILFQKQNGFSIFSFPNIFVAIRYIALA